MSQNTRSDITPGEWRFVLVLGVMVALLALLPLVSLIVQPTTTPPQQFMGVMHDFTDGARLLSGVRLGEEGAWLWQARHTPEALPGMLIDMLYLVIGHVARLTSIEGIVLFQVVRVLAALFMVQALYVLGAEIWSKPRTRRIFLVVVTLASGIGWILAPLLDQPGFVDLTLSPIFPFHAVLTNVHLPLAIACQAFLMAAFIDALRPGNSQRPSVQNYGLTVLVFSLTLAFLYVQAWFPLALALMGAVALHVRKNPDSLRRDLMLLAWFIVPALPLLAYEVAMYVHQPLVAELLSQNNTTRVPSLLLLLGGLGVPLLLALPGLWRAARKLEMDGSALMLLWMLAMLALAYFSQIGRGQFLLGLMIPVSYFAGRGLEDAIFRRLHAPGWWRLALVMMPLLLVSQFYVLYVPITRLSFASGNAPTLGRDYVFAFQALQTLPKGVVLASPHASLWVPAWAGQQVIYGNDEATLDPAGKRAAVEAWFSATDPAQCARLLSGAVSKAAPYTVRYVLYGPEEAAYGSTVCTDGLQRIARFGTVTLYRVP